MISSQMIITELKRMYNETGKTPKYKDFKWSLRTVKRRFGSWAKALIAAEIPLHNNIDEIHQCSPKPPLGEIKDFEIWE